MKKLSAEQKKILLMSAIAVGVLLVFWLLIYLPSENKLKALKQELALTQSQIESINAIIKGKNSAEEGIRQLKEDYAVLKNRFPAQEQEGTAALSGIAKKLNVEVASVKSEESHPFRDAENQTVSIEGKTCQVVPVIAEMKCSYRDLVKYLFTIKQTLPAYETLEKIKISKDKFGSGKLNITLELNLYLLN